MRGHFLSTVQLNQERPSWGAPIAKACRASFHARLSAGVPNWIGTMTTDSRRGAYLLMAHLYGMLGHRDPRIIGITGDPSPPVSAERAQGVDDYVARARRGLVLQLVFGDWTFADGLQKAAILLARHPQANVVWRPTTRWRWAHFMR